MHLPSKAVFSGLGLWAFTSRYKLGTLIMRFDVRRYSLVSFDIIIKQIFYRILFTGDYRTGFAFVNWFDNDRFVAFE